MDKFKALTLVLLGMVIGLGYAVACGSDDDKGTAGPMLPGVGVAMAQGCAQWEVLAFEADLDIATLESVGASQRALLPSGFTPLSGSDDGTTQFAWAARCAQ